jgi:hypothetical protein
LISSLISEALTDITVSSDYSITGLRSGGYVVGQLREPIPHRAVHDKISGTHDYAADQLLIYLAMQANVAAQSIAQRRRKFGFGGIVEFECGLHLDIDGAFLLGPVHGEKTGDFRQQIETMLFGQQPNKVGTALTGGFPGHRDYDIGDFAGVYSRVRDRHSGVGIADRRGCMFKQLRPLL